MNSGERARLACWRSRPRDRGLFGKRLSAGAETDTRGRVCSPDCNPPSSIYNHRFEFRYSDFEILKGGIAQLVERQLCKLDVRGSNPLASISNEMEAEMRTQFDWWGG
jgi:hypothetical protein